MVTGSLLIISRVSLLPSPRGIGKSGEIRIETSGQQILARNSVLIDIEGIEARLTVGLSATGQKIMAGEVEEMFFREVPEVVAHGLYGSSAEFVGS